MYRWLHDQTMRRANHGMTMREIAEDLQQPECFATQSHTRATTGRSATTQRRCISATSAGTTATRPTSTRTRLRKRKALRRRDGRPDQVHAEAQRAFNEGDYRWAAELLNHLVFADPTYEPGRLLQADTFEQLGYQSESGPWRDSYLMGAMELRPARRASRCSWVVRSPISSTSTCWWS